MLIYELVNFKYIPVSLNLLVEKNKFNLLNGNYLSCEFLGKLFDEIYKNGTGTYVLDMKEINLGDSRCFSRFNEFESIDNIVLIFINFNEKIKDCLTYDCPSYLIYNDHNNIISCINGIQFFSNIIKSIHGIDLELRKYISNKISGNLIEKEQFLKSSNIYVNKYVNIKKILLSPSDNYLILFELALLIKPKTNNFDKLICCSFNGAVIATMLGQLLSKEVVYLMNLGPTISYYNIDMVSEIINKNNYLFVADMICLGTEFNLTKTIVKLHKAELIGVACIVKYLDPAYAKCVISLVEINDGDSFDYKVFIKK